MDVGDFELRLGRFCHVGKECLEILVLNFRLGISRRSTFCVPRVRDPQLSPRNILRIRIGVDEGLQGKARDLELVGLQRL